MFQQQLYAIADVFGATRSPRVGDQQVGARLTDVVPSPPARRVVRGASAPSVSSGHPNPTTLCSLEVSGRASGHACGASGRVRICGVCPENSFFLRFVPASHQ